jgi:hypothetical protein
MNYLFIYLIKIFRKLYTILFGIKLIQRLKYDQDPDSASQKIYESLIADSPCMIARFGANELSCLINYLGVSKGAKNILMYIKGQENAWWWEKNTIERMFNNAGFFPAREDKIEEFCRLMITDIPEVDILGSWLKEERVFEKELLKAYKVRFVLLDPYWAKNPWTKALEGKKVLVVHPFAKTIEQQYKKRELLFGNNLLPEFELKTIKAVQSIAGAKTPFSDWFEALEYMKSEIDKVDYDICLIGCGAYGFPLAAHVKRMGKKGFQLGGSLQLLFGIEGKRWNKDYSKDYDYSILPNENWINPGAEEKPEGAEKVEGACYW